MRHIAEVLADNIRAPAAAPLPPAVVTAIIRLVLRPLPVNAPSDAELRSPNRKIRRAAQQAKMEINTKLYAADLEKIRALGLSVIPGFTLPIVVVKGAQAAIDKLDELTEVEKLAHN